MEFAIGGDLYYHLNRQVGLENIFSRENHSFFTILGRQIQGGLLRESYPLLWCRNCIGTWLSARQQYVRIIWQTIQNFKCSLLFLWVQSVSRLEAGKFVAGQGWAHQNCGLRPLQGGHLLQRANPNLLRDARVFGARGVGGKRFLIFLISNYFFNFNFWRLWPIRGLVGSWSGDVRDDVRSVALLLKVKNIYIWKDGKYLKNHFRYICQKIFSIGLFNSKIFR